MAENNEQDFKKVIEEFSKANQLEYTKALDEMRQSLADNGEEMSDFSKGILEQAASITGDNRKASKSDQKKSLQEIAALEKSIAQEKNVKSREIVQAHLKSLKGATKENTTLSKRVGDGLMNNIDSIGGVIAGVLADSPILAVGAGKLIEVFKDRNKDKESLDTQELERIEQARNQFLEKQASEADDGEPEKEDGEDTAQDNQDLLEKIPEQLGMDLEPIKEAVEGMHMAMVEGEGNAEQNRREELARSKKAAKKAGGAGGGDDEDPEDATGPGGLLAFLGISKFLGGFKSMIGGFFKAIGPMFMKVLTKVFLPLVIIGSLFNGIMDGFQAWKDTGSIVEAIKAFGAGIVEFLSFGLIDKEMFNQAVAWVSDKMTLVFSSIGEVFDGLVVAVKGFFADNPIIGDTVAMIGGMGTKIFDLMTAPMRFLLSKFENTFPDISAKIGDVFTGIIDGIKGVLLKMVDALPDWMVSDSIRSALSVDTATTPQTAGQGVTDVANDLSTGNEAMKDQAKQGAGDTNVTSVNASSNVNNNIIPKILPRNQYAPQGT